MTAMILEDMQHHCLIYKLQLDLQYSTNHAIITGPTGYIVLASHVLIIVLWNFALFNEVASYIQCRNDYMKSLRFKLYIF